MGDEDAEQNGMDEWQVAENEKLRLMECVSGEVDKLKMSREEWRSRAECAEGRIRGWVRRVERLEKQRDAARAENARREIGIETLTRPGGLVPVDVETTAALVREVLRLRKGIQDYLDGDYENPRQHRCMSDKGKCKHGIYWWEECGSCGDEHFSNLLQPPITSDLLMEKQTPGA